MESQRLATLLQRQPFAPWPYFEELVPTDRQWHYRRERFSGAPHLIPKLLYERPRPGQTLDDFLLA
jgi:hypothetical protein